MHHYPRNSPQAAARLVAAAMLADGNVCWSEIEALRRDGIETRIGLPNGGMEVVMRTLCEDLLVAGMAPDALLSDAEPSLLESLVHELDDAALQRLVMDTVTAVSAADGHLSEAEQRVLETMARCWGLELRHASLAPM